ncbi:TlpA disulfide reductase family protein [Urechidicola sp. KH5]
MKKIFVAFLLVGLIVGCKEPKGYMALSGKVENAASDKIEILSRDYSKTIAVDANGNFKDTLKLPTGMYTFSDGTNRTIIYLANGYNLNVNIDTEDFRNPKITGNGSASNNYMYEQINFNTSEYANPKSFYILDKTEFDQRLEDLKDYLNKPSTKNVDTTLVAQIQAGQKQYIDFLVKNYPINHERSLKFAKGKPSPKFNDFENFKGGNSSLDDFKGKYVYIDVWATWCGPCKQQIPYLKEVEEDYHDKNIAFISISTDRLNKYNAWRKMIEDYQMGGVQLFAGEDISFSQAYEINSIPRFLLIDPEGNIVDADAPRPSDPRLRALFDSLDI